MMIDSPEAMLIAGRDLAAKLGKGDVVSLSGSLGAGKTLLCKGILQGLGFCGDVPSPSFTIMNHYAPPDVRLPVIHADLYRLNAADELEELGLLESESDDYIRLVEWPEHGGTAFDGARFKVRIAAVSEGIRELNIEEKS